MESDSLLRKNAIFRNSHKGKKCFIIGNGPSIANQNLLLLKNDIKIVVSSFYRHPQAKELHPEYWVVADPQYWTNPENTLDPLLVALDDKCIATRLFMPQDAAELMEKKYYGLQMEPHFYLYGTLGEMPQNIDFSTAIPPFGQNVICVAIMLALYLGCNNIYLLGCDHDWWEYSRESYDEDCSKYTHFYNKPTDVNLKTISEQLTFEELSKTIENQRYQYEKLRLYGKRKGQYIYNATEGGFLDIFPRVKYESLFPFGASNIAEDWRTQADTEKDFIKPAIELLKKNEYIASLALFDEAICRGIITKADYKQVHYLRAICFEKIGCKYEAMYSRMVSEQDITETRMAYNGKLKYYWMECLYFIRGKASKIEFLKNLYHKYRKLGDTGFREK